MPAHVISGESGSALMALMRRDQIIAGPNIKITSRDENGTFLQRQIKTGGGAGGCWSFAWLPIGSGGSRSLGLIWPDQTEAPNFRSFASDSGWYWHDHCFRLFRYNRNTVTGALSDRRVMRLQRQHSFEDNLDPDSGTPGAGPEFYETFLGDLIVSGDPDPFTNWYEPSAGDVSNMVALVAPLDCAGSDTGLMEVLIKVHFYRERKWHLDGMGDHYGVVPVWDYRTGEDGSLPVIQEVAWRYLPN